jgi:MFS family permease
LGIPVLSSLPFAKLASKIGYKKTSLISSPLILLFYLLIRKISAGSLESYIIAFIGGLGFNMYWIGMNPEMATSSDSKKRTEESGYFFSMSSLAAAISPFLGGLVLASFNFNALFLIATLIILFSFIPFFFSKRHREGMESNIMDFAKSFPKADFATFYAAGAIFLGKMLVWPFYLATFIQGSISIGGAGSIIAITSGITSAFIGKISSKYGKVRIVGIASMITAFTYLVMSIVSTPMQAFVISGLNGLSFTIFNVPIFSTAMDHSQHKDKLEYFALREIAITLGRITLLLIFTVVFFTFSIKSSFLISFSILALFSIILPYLDRKMEK